MIRRKLLWRFIRILDVNHPFYGTRHVSMYAVMEQLCITTPRHARHEQSARLSPLSEQPHSPNVISKYLPPMDPSSEPNNDTTKTASPPGVISKSTSISSQSRTKLTDSKPHQATSRPTSQGKLSYADAAKKAVSNERLDSAASASPRAASDRQSRTKDARPENNRTTAVPATVSRDRQATMKRTDTNKLDVELDAQTRADQVSPCVAVFTYTCDSYLWLSGSATASR